MAAADTPSSPRSFPWLMAGAGAIALHLLWLAPSVRASTAASYVVAAAGAGAILAIAVALRLRHPVPGAPFHAWWLLTLIGLSAAAALWGLRDSASAAPTAAAATLVAGAPGAALLCRPATLFLLRLQGRRNGITLPPGTHLWTAGGMDCVLLDKHRSVTTGAMEITEVEPIDQDHRNSLLFFAGALSHAADGAAAAALARRSGRGRVADFREVPGKGIVGSVDRHPVRVGAAPWLGLPDSSHRGTTLAVEVDLRALGTITLDDVIRPGAAQRCSELAAYAPVTLVTDASPADAAALADELGVAHHVADCDGDGRLDLVKRTQGDGRRTCFIATRTPTNQSALEQCDIAVTDDSGAPSLPHAVQLSDFGIDSILRGLALTRRARGIVDQAGRVAAALSILGGIAAATGLLSLPLASGVGLLVTAGVVVWSSLAVRRA